MRKYWIFWGDLILVKTQVGDFYFVPMNNLQSSYNTSKSKRITQIQEQSFQSLNLKIERLEA